MKQAQDHPPKLLESALATQQTYSVGAVLPMEKHLLLSSSILRIFANQDLQFQYKNQKQTILMILHTK
jgi:hypothetical protein